MLAAAARISFCQKENEEEEEEEEEEETGHGALCCYNGSH